MCGFRININVWIYKCPPSDVPSFQGLRKFGKLCRGWVKERNCGENPGSVICEANKDISEMYGRKGVQKLPGPEPIPLPFQAVSAPPKTRGPTTLATGAKMATCDVRTSR